MAVRALPFVLYLIVSLSLIGGSFYYWLAHAERSREGMLVFLAATLLAVALLRWIGPRRT